MLAVRHRQPVVGVDVLVRRVSGDAIGLAVLVSENQHRAGRPLAFTVELDVVLDLDEPLRQVAVREGDAAVNVLYCAVG